MSLSSTEVEYRAQSDIVAEVLFVKMLLNFLKIPLKLPITV